MTARAGEGALGGGLPVVSDDGRTRLGGRSRDEVESERERGRGGVGDVRELAGEGGRAGRPGVGFEGEPGDPGRMGIGRICVREEGDERG